MLFQIAYFICIKLDIHAYTLIYVLESGDMNVSKKQRKKQAQQAVYGSDTGYRPDEICP